MNVPAEIRTALLEPHRIRNAIPANPGMSGSLVFRCHGERAWALRRYPESTSLARVREIHCVIGPLSEQNNLIPGYGVAAQCSPVGEKTTAVRDNGGGIWELQQWMPGAPLPDDASLERVTQGAIAICGLHHQLARLPVTPGLELPAIVQRRERLRWLVGQIPSARLEPGDYPPDLAESLGRACHWMRTEFPRVLPGLNRELARFSDLGRDNLGYTQWVFRDIHREHLLVEGGEVSGLIDFDALRVDTPATDLARWLGGFECFWDDSESTERLLRGCLAASDPDCPLSSMLGGNLAELDRLRTLIRTLAVTGAWISLGNWLVWLLIEGRQFARMCETRRRIDWWLRAVVSTV